MSSNFVIQVISRVSTGNNVQHI